MIYLEKDNYLAKGTERAFYLHPDNDTQGIKVYWKRRRRRNDSVNEWNYARRAKKCKCVALPIRRELTNLGEGLIVPLVKNEDGSLSFTLKTAVREKKLSQKDISKGLLVFKEALLQNNVAVTDVASSNLLCQLDLAGNLKRFVLVDGFGYSHFFSISKIIPSVRRRKTLRRFNRILTKYIVN